MPKRDNLEFEKSVGDTENTARRALKRSHVVHLNSLITNKIEDLVISKAIGDTNEFKKTKHKKARKHDGYISEDTQSLSERKSKKLKRNNEATMQALQGAPKWSSTKLAREEKPEKNTKKVKVSARRALEDIRNDWQMEHSSEESQHLPKKKSKKPKAFTDSALVLPKFPRHAIYESRSERKSQLDMPKKTGILQTDKNTPVVLATWSKCLKPQDPESKNQLSPEQKGSKFSPSTLLLSNSRTTKISKRQIFENPITSKQIQVNTLSGKSARVISAMSATRYGNNGNATTIKGVKFQLPREVITNFNSSATLTKVSKTTMRCSTPVDAIDIIEEIPMTEIYAKQSVQSIKSNQSIHGRVTRACVRYSQVGQKALSFLNDEVSAALRNSLYNIDDIQMRIRKTVDEINECDKLYRQLKSHSLCSYNLLGTTRSFSTVSITSSHVFKEIKDDTQSTLKNRSSLVIVSHFDNVTNTISSKQLGKGPESPKLIPARPQTPRSFLQTRPHTPNDLKSESDVSIISQDSIRPRVTISSFHPTLYSIPTGATPLRGNEPIMPKIIQIAENQPYAMLTQQKPNIYNIPTTFTSEATPRPKSRSLTVRSEDVVPLESGPKQLLRELRSVVTPVLDVELPQPPVVNKVLPPPKEEEFTTSITVNLPRMKGHADLHGRLVKEFKATDSLLEFQQQMQHLARNKKDNGIEILAEELYIPERKINKIAATNLNAPSKTKSPDAKAKPGTCQFFYREKKGNSIIVKKTKVERSTKTSLVNVQDKYPDSVLFATRKKHAKGDNLASLVKNIDSRSYCSLIQSCDSSVISKTNTVTDNNKTGLDCFDILDEITLNDVKPFESEYPRKDHILPKRPQTPVEDTFLYKLMYGQCQHNFLELLKSQEPTIRCQTPDCKTCSSGTQLLNKSREGKRIVMRKTEELVPSPPPPPPPTPVKKEKRTPRKELKRKRKEAMSNIVPKRNQIVNADQKGRASNKTRKSKKFGDDEIARKLRPYIFDPRMRYPTTITVMPVMVTTYANPNFVQGKKNQSGDFAANTKQAKGEAKEKLYKPVKNFYKPISPAEKKLWNNKYPKGPNYNLMNYLQKQSVEGPQQLYGESWEEAAIRNPKLIQQLTAPVKQKKGLLAPHDVYIQPTSYLSNQSQSSVNKTPRMYNSPITTKSSIRTNKKPGSPRSMFHKHAAESCKLLKDIQILSQKTKLETSIQSVIDMIENKIIEILSSPEESHAEAFKTVEAKIVEILNTIQAQNPKALDSIDETSDSSPPTSEREPKTNKNKFVSKTSAQLEKSEDHSSLHSETEPQLSSVDKADSDATSVSKSSNEERFEMTSSCSPKQHLLEKLNETKPVKEHGDADVLKNIATTVTKVTVPDTKPPNATNVTIDTVEVFDAEPLKITVPLIPVKAPRKVFKSTRKQASDLKTKQHSDVDKQEKETQLLKKASSEHLELDTSDRKEVESDDECETIKENVMMNALLKMPLAKAAGDMPVVKLEPGNNMQLVPKEIHSDDFATPFVEALKQYHPDDSNSCDILRILDNLTSISNADSNTSTQDKPLAITYNDSLRKIKRIYFNHKVYTASVLCQSHVFYPVTISCPIKTMTLSSEDLKVLFQCQWFDKITSTMTVINDLKSAMQSYTPLSLSRLLTYDDSTPKSRSSDDVFMCYPMSKTVPRVSICRTSSSIEIEDGLKEEIKGCSRTKMCVEEVEPLYDHASLLNSIYGVLFTAIFFSLTFNYTCQ